MPGRMDRVGRSNRRFYVRLAARLRYSGKWVWVGVAWCVVMRTCVRMRAELRGLRKEEGFFVMALAYALMVSVLNGGGMARTE